MAESVLVLLVLLALVIDVRMLANEVRVAYWRYHWAVKWWWTRGVKAYSGLCLGLVCTLSLFLPVSGLTATLLFFLMGIGFGFAAESLRSG